MDDSLDLCLQELSAQGYEPFLQGIRGTFRFEIAGYGSRTIHVEDGAVALTDCSAEADCVLSASPEDFDRMACGEQSAQTSRLRGELHVWGDYPLAARIAHYLFELRPWLRPAGQLMGSDVGCSSRHLLNLASDGPKLQEFGGWYPTRRVVT
jgi:hypothetical protein